MAHDIHFLIIDIKDQSVITLIKLLTIRHLSIYMLEEMFDI